MMEHAALSGRRRGRLIGLVGMLCLLAAASCATAGADAAGSAPVPEPEPEREVVVLVHGMGRSSLSMIPLSWTLERAGYRVVNWGYSSVCCGIETLSARLERDLVDELGSGTGRVHFVGHSLGNILIRRVIASGGVAPDIGRVVMLAPPNQGSHTADRLAEPLGWLLKPLPELQTTAAWDDPDLAIPEEVQVGIIAGEYDGKVSVPETRLDGMDERVVLPATHSFLMYRRDVHRMILEYLRAGTFDAAPNTQLTTEPR